jgi:hypothetical protein
MICDRDESTRGSINLCECQVCAVNDYVFWCIPWFAYHIVCVCNTRESGSAETICISCNYNAWFKFSAFDGGFAPLIVFWLLTPCGIMFVPKLLTPWSRVLLEKLTGVQLDKKFPPFYGTRRFFTAFTSARSFSEHWYLFTKYSSRILRNVCTRQLVCMTLRLF